MSDPAAASTTAIMAGIAAFSAFVPQPSEAIKTEPSVVRIGQLYASGATLVVSFILAKSTGNMLPLSMGLFVIGLELASYYHALSAPRVVNQ